MMKRLAGFSVFKEKKRKAPSHPSRIPPLFLEGGGLVFWYIYWALLVSVILKYVRKCICL